MGLRAQPVRMGQLDRKVRPVLRETPELMGAMALQGFKVSGASLVATAVTVLPVYRAGPA
jgi:hypothetical protein